MSTPQASHMLRQSVSGLSKFSLLLRLDGPHGQTNIVSLQLRTPQSNYSTPDCSLRQMRQDASDWVIL